MLYIVTPQAACRHVAKCRVLGAQFCNWNPMTERMEFLHLTATTRDVFAKSWALISEKKLMQEGENMQQGKNGKDLKQGEKVEVLKQGEKGKNLVEDLKQGENGEGTKKRKSEAPEAPEQDGKVDKNKNKKAKNLLDLLFGKAIQSKNLYLKVTGQAAALLEQVTSDPEFEWASDADPLASAHCTACCGKAGGPVHPHAGDWHWHQPDQAEVQRPGARAGGQAARCLPHGLLPEAA